MSNTPERFLDLGGDGDRLLDVEHSVAPGLWDDHHVARCLDTRLGAEPASVRPTLEVLHVGLHVLEDLQVAHDLVLGRVEEPFLRTVHQRIPCCVVMMYCRDSR